MTMYDITTGGIAALAERSDGRTPVSGVLIGEGDITEGLSGKRTRWPAAVLEDMVGVFDGKPITMADAADPEQHVGVELTEDGPQLTGAVSMDEKVGEIAQTVYEDGVGLLYEGFVADAQAADAVEAGLAQVSPVVMRDVEPVDAEPDLFEVSEVFGGRDVAIVADGAVPSNEIQPGELPATAEALSTHFGTEFAEALSAASDGGDGGADDPRGDDGPDGSKGQSTSVSPGLPTMDDLTDHERELVAAARQKDDPTVVEAEVPDRLTELEEQIDDHEEIIDEATDLEEPAVMEAETAEALRERVNIVENLMAEALQERTGLSEAAVDAMPFEAMAAEFETDEGDLDVEALTQSPETGSGPTGDGSDGDNGLSDEDVERIEEIEQKLDTVGSALPDSRVEALQQEAADIADADDYEGALEVL